jgi:hypothetical protein
MAVKKSKPAEAEAKKAPSKTSTTKPKKAAATKAKESKPVVASDTASKAETPKPTTAAPKKSAAAPAKKAAAPVKLTENQLKFLKQIQEAKEGFSTAKKAEEKTIETLLDKKLIKKAAKDKASGKYRYIVSKAGEKHLSTIPPA